MSTKRIELLAKLQELIERDATNKRHAEKLNQDISYFISEDLGLKGPATLLDISKKLLETTIDESLIIKP